MGATWSHMCMKHQLEQRLPLMADPPPSFSSTGLSRRLSGRRLAHVFVSTVMSSAKTPPKYWAHVELISIWPSCSLFPPNFLGGKWGNARGIYTILPRGNKVENNPVVLGFQRSSGKIGWMQPHLHYFPSHVEEWEKSQTKSFSWFFPLKKGLHWSEFWIFMCPWL